MCVCPENSIKVFKSVSPAITVIEVLGLTVSYNYCFHISAWSADLELSEFPSRTIKFSFFKVALMTN